MDSTVGSACVHSCYSQHPRILGSTTQKQKAKLSTPRCKNAILHKTSHKATRGSRTCLLMAGLSALLAPLDLAAAAAACALPATTLAFLAGGPSLISSASPAISENAQ